MMWIKRTLIIVCFVFLLMILAVTLAQQSLSCNLFYGNIIETVASINSCVKAASSAENYYEFIRMQDYDDAFKYVGYYTDYSDIHPQLSYNEARMVWKERIIRLKENKTYVLAVNSIDVFIDDGYPRGIANVCVVENGIQKNIIQRIHFIERDGWKVQTAASQDGPTALDETLSGWIQTP